MEATSGAREESPIEVVAGKWGRDSTNVTSALVK
jgi:hypothetical protein